MATTTAQTLRARGVTARTGLEASAYRVTRVLQAAARTPTAIRRANANSAGLESALQAAACLAQTIRFAVLQAATDA